jgi:thiamine kinase-like enzyme
MSSLTYSDIQTIISRIFGITVKLLSYRFEIFSTNSTGILGTHRSLLVDIIDESSKNNEVKSMSFFVKTRPDSKIQNFIMDDSIFDEEVFFYNKIHHLMLDSKCEKWSPQCYLARPDVLVFEDLRSQNFYLCEEYILNEQHVKSALTALARFHGSSIVVEKRLGKPLQEVFAEAFVEKLFLDSTKMGQVTRVGIETIALIAKRFDMDMDLVAKVSDRACEMAKNNTTGFGVICHGDLWKNNLLFDDCQPPNCILIDYQILRYHSPVTDVHMLLYLNMIPETRQQMEMSLLEHYYSVLQDVLARSDCKLLTPTYESIVKDYQEYRLVGILYACIYQPALYMKSNLVKILNDSVLLKNWLLETRMDQIELTMNNDPVYERNIKKFIKEFVEEGKRVLGM